MNSSNITTWYLMLGFSLLLLEGLVEHRVSIAYHPHANLHIETDGLSSIQC